MLLLTECECRLGGKRMPRARKRASTSRASAPQARVSKASTSRASRPATSNKTGGRAGKFVCPECGRSFTRAAALGAHRSRVHDVAGQSAQAKKNRARRQGATTQTTATATTRRSTAATTRNRSASQTRASRRRQPSSSTSRDGIDRDALLKALFPTGMPAREQVIRAVSGWLDDAERLTRMR
jgi:hypothetical protein